MSDRQISASLGISEKTVRTAHTSNIYRKLHIFEVIYAIREDVIDIEKLEYCPQRHGDRNLRALARLTL